MTHRLYSTFAVLVLAAALLPMSAVATPADTTDTPDPLAKATLLRLLNADSVTKQERAVRHIGTYAHTGRYDDSFFRPFVTPLHGLVATGKSEAVRIMAVSALASIGTDRAMEGLRAQVPSLRPVRVQKLTKYAVAAYDANRVPTRSVGTKQ